VLATHVQERSNSHVPSTAAGMRPSLPLGYAPPDAHSTLMVSGMISDCCLNISTRGNVSNFVQPHQYQRLVNYGCATALGSSMFRQRVMDASGLIPVSGNR
jgi:hypothetical protein